MKERSFYQLARDRRSTRVFTEDPVPEDAVRRIVGAALETPTSCNRQLWHCVIVTDSETKIRMNDLSRAKQSYLYDAPVLLAVFYDCTLENRNPCKTPFISAGMALYAMLLAAEEEGLGAIYLGGIRRPTGIAEALNAPPHLTNVGVICLGHPADNPPRPSHRSIDEIISYNQCDLEKPHFLADIRPHLWDLQQLADFRDKLTWYKGVHIDGRTLHTDPDARFSDKYRYLTERIGMLSTQYENPDILDVLSLNGNLILQILNTCGNDLKTLYAYELTDGTIEYMREYFKQILPWPALLKPLVNQGLEKLAIPLPDNSVDLITCYERLEHFEDPLPLVKEIYRILRPGGKALVTVSNRFYPHFYRYKRMRDEQYSLGRNWNRGPERKYEPRRIEQHFRDVGFRIDSLTGLQPVEQKILSTLKQIAEKLKRHNWADALADRHKRMYTNHSKSRRFCSSLAYELSK